MKPAYSVAPDRDNQTIWCLEKAAYQFSGPPADCVGTLVFINHSDESIKIRELALSVPKQSLAENASALPLGSASMNCRAKLAPRATVKVMARLPLHPATLPGTYTVTLHVGAHCFNATVKVTAHEQLQIVPRRLNFEGASGDHVSACVRFENHGNTSISLQDLSMVWLEEKNWAGHTLVQSIRDAAAGADAIGYLNTLIKNLQGSMVTPVKVELSPGEPTVIHPGEQLEKTVSLILPPGLKKGKTYHGFIKIRRYRLWLAVYCNGSPHSSLRR